MQRSIFFHDGIDVLLCAYNRKPSKKMLNEKNAYNTRKELAARLGVSRVTIAEWEKHGCPAVHIGKLARGKGCRPRYDFEKVKAWLESRSAACGNDTQKGGAA